MAINWTNTTVKLGELKPWADNPRCSTKKQAKRILESFDKFGQVQTIAVSPTLDVYDGHQRLSALLTIYGADYTVDARQSDRPLTDDERRQLVITLHTGATGAWDWDLLSGWDAGQLMADGFDVDALKDWKRDVTALDALLKSEEPDVEESVDLLGIGIVRQRWSFKYDRGFFCVRSFNTRKKQSELELLKKIKKERLFIEEISLEIAAKIMQTFGNLSDFCITSAPEHRTGFSCLLAKRISEIINSDYINLFISNVDDKSKITIFGEREEIKLNGVAPSRIIIIDDTLTTGRTLKTCLDLCDNRTVIPVVWIYDDAKPE